MVWKKGLIHGIISGIVAAVAGIIYFQLYKEALGSDFSRIVNNVGIAGSSVFGCLLMSLGLALLEKADKGRFSGIYYLTLFLLSYLSILGPLSISLPIDIEKPELFPGLAIPMHFFPITSFLSTAPLFPHKPDSVPVMESPTISKS